MGGIRACGISVPARTIDNIRPLVIAKRDDAHFFLNPFDLKKFIGPLLKI